MGKIKYNIELIDYVQYRFYFKRRIERDQFITHGKLLKIIKICNDPKSRIFLIRNHCLIKSLKTI